VRSAFKNRSNDNINTAVGSVAGVVSTATSVAKDGLSTVGNVRNYQLVRNAANDRFRQAAPQASKQVARNVASAATREVLNEGSRNAVRAAARNAAGPGMKGAANVSANAARGALRGGGSTLAKAAGRFTPGANIGIALADTTVAVSTLRNPKASFGKKATSVLTAAGSIAAATNIPGVSQVGAVGSTVSSFAGGFFD
jgi:hypothetical protein